MKESEGIFDDSVIFVTTQGSVIGIDGGRIRVTKKGEGELASFPIGKVDTINVFGGVNFTTPFVASANEHGIVLNYFTENGAYRGSFVPEMNTIAEIRRRQYAQTDAEKLVIAKRIIRAKIHNSRILLSRKGVKSTDKLLDIEVRVLEDKNIKNIDDLMGFEGMASDIYFSLLNECLVGDWTFEKRTRRPPQDHINALMSLTYTMIKNEVQSGLRQYNLDPFLGIMHADRHGRPALALDLIEEFRAIFADAFVLRLVNRGEITHDDFGVDNRLIKDAFKKYLEKYDEYMKEEFNHPKFEYTVNRRKAIRMQAILLRKAITGELKEYYPLEYPK
ncbi:type I-D CRISPR-associated endonuclease Cas1d [Candidatus Methanoperedens nitratireducens]|uniref:CRISPR-associated endonuclease Cas1 n=1 Tax=Candidatus Methanoperedens nitratireducens TaxID=1392998 RepID=A0A284VT42_9EURY|nr:type I-D CRISPR-associated endonuclease Cas1d [Candidatus Methanoperedens nitroreducens]SNQ62353.1 CRISPR-associated endonuclease Cas1 4 [Candidatus Methanoperedens nitroreducens]